MKCLKFGTIKLVGTIDGTTIDISDLHLSSAEDYMVFLDYGNYTSNTPAVRDTYISNKNATSFIVKSAIDYNFSYQVIGFN